MGLGRGGGGGLKNTLITGSLTNIVYLGLRWEELQEDVSRIYCPCSEVRIIMGCLLCVVPKTAVHGIYIIHIYIIQYIIYNIFICRSYHRQAKIRETNPLSTTTIGLAQVVEAGGSGSSGGEKNDVYSLEELSRWKPAQLKILLSELGLDASGCAEKRDVVDKIARHPGGLAAAAAAAIVRGEAVRQNTGQKGVGKSEAVVIGSGGNDGLAARAEGKGGAVKSLGDDTEALGLEKMAVSAQGVGADGYLGKDDKAMGNKIGDKTASHSSSAEMRATAAATAIQQPSDQDDNLVGMTLADYMSRSPAENEAERGHGHGHGHGRGWPAASGVDDRMKDPSAVSVSGSVGRPNSALAAPGHRTVVRLAPAHIAPPSRPAPEWVLDMQVRPSEPHYGRIAIRCCN